MMDKKSTIFMATNVHGEGSGEPPQIISGGKKYCGYFENSYGEQALFVFDYETRIGTLWMGDAGWEEPHEVIDGDVPDLELSAEEKEWLQACWTASQVRNRYG